VRPTVDSSYVVVVVVVVVVVPQAGRPDRSKWRIGRGVEGEQASGRDQRRPLD
jgi:hypothetical protein